MRELARRHTQTTLSHRVRLNADSFFFDARPPVGWVFFSSMRKRTFPPSDACIDGLAKRIRRAVCLADSPDMPASDPKRSADHATCPRRSKRPRTSTHLQTDACRHASEMARCAAMSVEKWRGELAPCALRAQALEHRCNDVQKRLREMVCENKYLTRRLALMASRSVLEDMSTQHGCEGDWMHPRWVS